MCVCGGGGCTSGGFLGNCGMSDMEDAALLGKLKGMVIILVGGWVDL